MSTLYFWVIPLYFPLTHQGSDLNCLRANPRVIDGEFQFLGKHTIDKTATTKDYTNSLALFSTRFKRVHKLLNASLELVKKIGFEMPRIPFSVGSNKNVSFFINTGGNKTRDLNKTILTYQQLYETIRKLNSAEESPIIEGIYLEPIMKQMGPQLEVVETVFGPKELSKIPLGILLEDCRWYLKEPSAIRYFIRLQFITCHITPQTESSPEKSALEVIKTCDEIRNNATSRKITAGIMCLVAYSSQGGEYYVTTLSSVRKFQIFWCSIVSELLRNDSHTRIIMRAAIDLTPAFNGEGDGFSHKDKYHTGWWKRSLLRGMESFVEKVEELPGGKEYEKCQGDCRLAPPLIPSTSPSQSFNFLTVTLISIFAFAGTFVVGVIGFVINRRRKANKALSRKELEQFFEGSNNSSKKSLQGDVDGNELVDNLPYDETLEVTKSEIGIYNDKVLGSGSFGVVVKGRIGPEEVAVKTTFPGVDKMFLKALMLELKVLSYLGQHDNIVNLRGAHTPLLTSGKLYLFLELCEHGNLLKFLRSHRDDFLDDETTEDTSKDYPQRRLTCKELLQWAVQIACAMVYLSEKRVVHGDIAARNVLVFSWDQVKLTDFGLSRRLYEYTNYVKKKQDPMPWRHMSVEALRDFNFSEQSDIWAFGVTLWETFSLGEIPFPGLSWSLDFLKMLQDGLRPVKPQHAHPLVYEVMTSCWKTETKLRPSIFSVHSKLSSALDELFTHPSYVCAGEIKPDFEHI